MMNLKGRYAAAAAAAFTLLLSGCGKKAETDAAAESATAAEGTGAAGKAANSAEAEQGNLPGAADVRSALANKDYNGAVERLVALRALAANDALYVEYKALVYEVGRGLEDAAETDPKAKEALAQYAAQMVGR